MKALRRVVQVSCLCLFIFLVMLTRHRGDQAEPLLQLFLDLDPLVALGTWLSTHTLAAGSLLALITIAATILLGRVFCGWICPLGAAHQVMTWLGRRGARLRPREERSPWQRLKYGILVALLVMALFGVHWTGVLDPMPLFYRSLTAFGVPAAQYSIEDSATSVYQSDPHLGPVHATSFTEPVYEFFRDRVFMAKRQQFQGSDLIAFFFVLILALNLLRPRFWCRYICPLGGLLGFLSQRPALRLENDTEKCNHCGLCARGCPAAAQPDQPGKWLKTECFECWDCVATCKQNALRFTLESPLKAPRAGKIDFTRRTAMGAVAGGVAALTGFRQTPLAQEVVFEPTLVRPPGALPEREFLQRCIQCGACMRTCPTNGLQPCGLEAGVEGLWTPKLVSKIGYCEYNCNRCGQVCPTGAIAPLNLDEKKKLKIGLAVFDKDRCLPYAYGRECMICEEHCPLPKKAIYFVEEEITLRTGEKIKMKQPCVDENLCTGCGICEWSCIYKDKAAVRVTSANESRNPKNLVMLEKPEEAPPAPDSQGNAGGSPYPPAPAGGNPYPPANAGGNPYAQ